MDKKRIIILDIFCQCVPPAFPRFYKQYDISVNIRSIKYTFYNNRQG